MASTAMKTPARWKGQGRGTVSVSQQKWVEVLVDLMLSLLSRPQQLWRNTIARTFSNLLPLMTGEAVELIVKVSANCRRMRRRNKFECMDVFLFQALEPQTIDELMETNEDQNERQVDDDDGTDSEDMDSVGEDSYTSEKVRRFS